MIALDTNVLVRFLAQDDPAQSKIATRVITQTLNAEDPGYVTLATMLETVWVLRGPLHLPRTEVAAAIQRILTTESLQVQNKQEVFTAYVALLEDVGSFEDALIGALGRWAGCTATLTFDRGTKRLKGFRLL